MRYLAFLVIVTFFSISALVSVRKEWFGFVYDVPGGDKFFHFVGMGLLLRFVWYSASHPCPRMAAGSVRLRFWLPQRC